jgi:uncharacterized membrane protein required for colicin V production
MPTAITIGTGLLLVGLAILGATRDVGRSVAALTGSLLGAVLVTFWAEPLANELSRRLGNSDVGTLTRVTSLALFGIAVVLVGYGSWLLLARSTHAAPLTRVVGGLLGLLNGGLIAGFVLRYAAYTNDPFLAFINASPLGWPIYERLPQLLLVATSIIGLLVVIRIVRTLISQRATAAAQSTSLPPRTNVQQDQNTLDKIKDRIG